MKRFLFVLVSAVVILVPTSCHKDDQTSNPFFEEWATEYGFPPFDSIQAVHFAPAIERAISIHNSEIAAISENKDEPTFKNTIEDLDRSGHMLVRVSDIFMMQSRADANEQMQAIEKQVQSMLTAHNSDIALNSALFSRISEVYQRRNSMDLKPDQIRLTERTYNWFVRLGAMLEGKDRLRIREIDNELTSLGLKFSNNILSEDREYTLKVPSSQANDIIGQPKDVARDMATKEGLMDQYIFTLHPTSIIPFLTTCSYRNLREQIYKAYLERGTHEDKYDNTKILNNILRLRTEKAHLLGFDSYADYVISDQMAKTPEKVYSTLEDIFKQAMNNASKDLDLMDDLLSDDISSATFESWDWWYYANKARRKNFSLNDEMLKPYFSLENVRQGVFNVANRLYGLSFRPMAVPVYNEEVTIFEVLDKDLSHLGILVLDLFRREFKRPGSWCGFYLRQRYSDNGLERTPSIVGISCNYQRPVQSNAQALLSLDQTAELFHVFGHALHMIFTNVRYNGLIYPEKELTELPSLIMENWAFEPDIIRSYASNNRSNEVISDSMIEKINRSRKFNQSFYLTRLIAAALLDLDVHSVKTFDNIDPVKFTQKALYDKRGMITSIEPLYRLPYFLPIFSQQHAASYYSYIWAEILDKDAFVAFCEGTDHTYRPTAEAFRHKILEKGGSEDGMTMYRNFRGSDPDITHMLRARGLWEDPEINEPNEDIEYIEEEEQQQQQQQPAQTKTKKQESKLHSARKLNSFS